MQSAGPSPLFILIPGQKQSWISSFQIIKSGHFLEKGFQLGQNLRELLQSDIHCYLRRAVPNWGRTYQGDATKHREETDVEGTHVSAKIWYPIVKMNTYEIRGGHTRAKKKQARTRKVSQLLL